MNYLLTIVVIVCTGAVAFLLCFLVALCRDKRDMSAARSAA